MKTYFKYIALALLLSFGLVSCKDNENWRIIPYEPQLRLMDRSNCMLWELIRGGHQMLRL